MQTIINKSAIVCASLSLVLILSFNVPLRAEEVAAPATITLTKEAPVTPVAETKNENGSFFSGLMQRLKKISTDKSDKQEQAPAAVAKPEAPTVEPVKKVEKPTVEKKAIVPPVEKKKTEVKSAPLKIVPQPKPSESEVKKPTTAAEAVGQKSDGKSTDPFIQEAEIDETLPLPPYPANAVTAVGKNEEYTLGEEDTLLDVARYFDIGFIELLAANPGVDSWTPEPEQKIILPRFRLIPRTAKQQGIIVNLAQMRLYYFDPSNKGKVVTFPIGIGREGLQTPVGETTVINKVANPRWNPTDRMREEKPWLPRSVAPGPSNPLGEYALYLGWPTFLIHGSNKPWAIGRRVSSGCMRMYPENIEKVFEMVPVGTKVTIVSQPVLVAEFDGKLYLEVNPSTKQGNAIEVEEPYDKKPLTPAIRKVIEQASGAKAKEIKWNIVEKAFDERRGYPVQIN